MIIKKVTYTDLDGNQVEDTLRFHLSKDELRTINSKFEGGVKGYISNLFVNEEDADKDAYLLYEFMKELILSAYGEKSADAKHFVKNAEIRDDFENSLAFEALMDEIVDKNEYESFIAGIVGMNAGDLENAKKAVMEDNTISPKVKNALMGSN